eukprot:Protomagalhaensia_wolfi_Nauph_80__4135@NODE_41_length_4357_cov_53_089162_g33_i0_p6_GENE_NODE_41_length_4357_cov_53_089162_g33_i0NODE_41_length_4357_cov_53_089162_g33_i0_p6_ORF_typecomplete_len133_score10_21Myofilin/PF15929_5/0_028_NODE_41_length_4357_cov_53_089162_g33_i09691367
MWNIANVFHDLGTGAVNPWLDLPRYHHWIIFRNLYNFVFRNIHVDHFFNFSRDLNHLLDFLNHWSGHIVRVQKLLWLLPLIDIAFVTCWRSFNHALYGFRSGLYNPMNLCFWVFYDGLSRFTTPHFPGFAFN